MRESTVLFLLGLSACGSDDAATCTDGEASLEQSIVNGAVEERYLALGAEDVAAIVAVSSGEPPQLALCSGVLITPEWVLTSAHCLQMEAPGVMLSTDAGGSLRAAVIERIAHPELDVGLLQIESVRGGTVPLRPLAVVTSSDRLELAGERVELAGFGVTESGTPQGLRFAVEPVVELTATLIRVNGAGRSGACLGDSGGPLIVRNIQGEPAVAGVLSSGSASCVGFDTYVRTDVIADWILSLTHEPREPQRACGRIDEHGACFFGSALRCVDGVLVSERCVDGGRCGWKTDVSVFACVAPADDTCRGAGSAGVCDGNVALSCPDGVVSVLDCGPCGACGYAPTSGAPRCFDRPGKGAP